MEEQYAQEASRLIPAEVTMIAACQDFEEGGDISDVRRFHLPDPKGKAGGAMSSAILSVLYQHDQSGTLDETSWVKLLGQVSLQLNQTGFTQKPVLSSSRLIDMRKSVQFCNNNNLGVKRAVLIGINYTGQKGELTGCWNDCRNMREYLVNIQGFKRDNVIMIMDDGVHFSPTRLNIITAFKNLVKHSVDGDTVFLHFSGHGGKTIDLNGDEDDGYDETLIPVDFRTHGQIVDDEIFEILVKPMAKGVKMTCLIDSCHSGTALDLPFTYTYDDAHAKDHNKASMRMSENFFVPHQKISKMGKQSDDNNSGWCCC